MGQQNSKRIKNKSKEWEKKERGKGRKEQTRIRGGEPKKSLRKKDNEEYFFG